jgi:hypothetical protein
MPVFHELISRETCDAVLLTRCTSGDEQDFAVERLIDGLHFENNAACKFDNWRLVKIYGIQVAVEWIESLLQSAVEASSADIK